jgi:hypothetical protein
VICTIWSRFVLYLVHVLLVMDIVRSSMTCHIYAELNAFVFCPSYCLIEQFGIIRVLCLLILLNLWIIWCTIYIAGCV